MPQVTNPQTLTVFAKELAPWSPDVDSRRSEKPGIVTGTNFFDDVDGPVSAWSNNFVNYNFWDQDERAKITELKIGTDVLYGTSVSGVWHLNQISGAMELVLNVSGLITKPFWPWSIAYVGGVYYLAQYDIGLWQYDPVNNTLAKIPTQDGTDQVRYVAESAGRLLYLSAAFVCYSAQDDGTNLTPSLTTAAGAQPISLIGGQAFRLESIPDGVLTYTANGIMKGTIVSAAYVFTWSVLKSKVKIFSPNAAVYVPKIGALSLDASGFSITKEYNYQDYGISQPWELLMGDYVQKNILNTLDRTLFGAINLYWSEVEQKLFVSFSGNTREGIMLKSFVYSPMSKKWSSFDHQQTGFFETYTVSNNTSRMSFMSTDGYMRVFSDTNYSEDEPPSPYTVLDYIFRNEAEQFILATVPTTGSPVVIQVGTTDINLSENNPFDYKSYPTGFGLFYINYTPYSDTDNDAIDDPDMVLGSVIVGGTYINMDVSGGVEQFAFGYMLPQIGVDAELTVGPFRFNDQVQADETSAVSTILVGLQPAGSFIITEDWMRDTGNEDWNTMSGTEDWDSGNQVPNNFDLILRSTDDGVNEPIQGDEELFPMNSMGSSIGYAPQGFSGVYHYLTFDANDVEQSFAIKTLDFTGLLTGRMPSQ